MKVSTPSSLSIELPSIASRMHVTVRQTSTSVFFTKPLFSLDQHWASQSVNFGQHNMLRSSWFAPVIAVKNTLKFERNVSWSLLNFVFSQQIHPSCYFINVIKHFIDIYVAIILTRLKSTFRSSSTFSRTSGAILALCTNQRMLNYS